MVVPPKKLCLFFKVRNRFCGLPRGGRARDLRRGTMSPGSQHPSLEATGPMSPPSPASTCFNHPFFALLISWAQEVLFWSLHL